MPKSTPKPRRALASALEESTTPPAELKPSQTIARVSKAEGNHLYSIFLPTAFHTTDMDTVTADTATADIDTPITSSSNPSSPPADALETRLVELMPALRSTIFLRRNGYVLVDTDRELLGGRENKIIGTIVGVVLGGGKTEREWRSMAYWPVEFGKTKSASWDYGGEGDGDSSDGDGGPRMPSSGDDD